MDSLIKNSGDIQLLIRRLRRLSFDERSDKLQDSSEYLTDILAILNSESCAEEREKLTGGNNPLKILLNLLKPEHRILLLKNTDRSYPLLYAAHEKDDVDTISCIISLVDDQEQVKMLKSIPWKGLTTLHAAIRYAEQAAVEHLVNEMSPKELMVAMKIQDQYFDTPLHTSIRCSNEAAAHLLLTKLQVEFMRSPVYIKDVEEVLSCPVGAAAEFITFWMAVMSGEAQKAVTTLYETHPTSADRLGLLSHTGSFNNIIHLICGDRHIERDGPRDAESLVRDIFKGLDIRDRADLLLPRTGYDGTALHIAAAGNDDVLQKLLKFVADPKRFPGNRLEEILLVCDSGGHTFLHVAAQYRSADAFMGSLGRLPVHIVKWLMSMREYWQGYTSLHKAVDNRADMDALLRQLMYCKNNEEMKDVLLLKDKYGQTFLHCVAERGTQKIIPDIGQILPSDLLAELLLAKDNHGRTVLHAALRNVESANVLSLFKLIVDKDAPVIHDRECAQQFLCAQDKDGETFLHEAVRSSSEEVVRTIVSELPPLTAKALAKIKNLKGVKARDVIEQGLKKDYVHQMGSMNPAIYPLEKPPKVKIFYNTNDRDLQNAMLEKDCVENYFMKRNILCDTTKNATSHQILSNIMAARTEDGLSALMVFVMGHGAKGVVHVEGGDLSIQSVIDAMASYESSIPKVLVVQACQNEPSREGNPTRSDPITSDRQFDADYHVHPKSYELRYPHFLILVATLTGHKAKPNFMIPCLMDSLKKMKVFSCLTEACRLTSTTMEKRRKKDSPEEDPQTPIYRCTLKRKLCITKFPVQQSEDNH